MSEGFNGTWPGSEDDTVDKARAWDAAVAVPPKVAAELTALRRQVSELRADLEAIRNVALVAEDAARIRQFIAAREKAPNA